MTMDLSCNSVLEQNWDFPSLTGWQEDHCCFQGPGFHFQDHLPDDYQETYPLQWEREDPLGQDPWGEACYAYHPLQCDPDW